MAFGFYMNMERLSLEIAKEHVQKMTDDNLWDDIFLDDNKLYNNIKNGFVVITQLITFIESFLNTILNNCIGYDDEKLLRVSIEEKLEIIFLYYKKDLSEIKSLYQWCVFGKVKKVRNEMVHFKKTYIGDGTGIPQFSIANHEVQEFFTKTNMEQIINQIIQLGDLVAEKLELDTFHDIDIFACDGRDGLVNYVFDPKIIDISESRPEYKGHK